MNFSLLLVLAVIVTGLIWLADLLWLRPQRKQSTSSAAKSPWYIDYPCSFFPVLLFVLVVRAFIIEPYQIPSGSMEPTLEVGDFIVVNKFSYGLRLPVSETKILSIGEPKRGDVAVFRYPVDPKTDFIKRIVGLPGDHVTYHGKRLYINGQLVDKQLVSDDVTASPGMQQWEESLGTVKHAVYNNPNDAGKEFDGTVPAGHFFVMGDNRDNSLDSRFWGFVPEENLVGRASAVWMHWHGGLPSFSNDRLIH